MGIGGLLLVGGGGLSLIAYASAASAQTGRFVIFSGAIMVGALQFIYGFIKYVTEPKIVDPFETSAADFKILLRAMVGAAEHSGGLDASDVDLMRSILKQVYGKDYDFATLAGACRALWGEGDDLTSHLFHANSQLSIEFRRIIVKAAAVVLSTRQSPVQINWSFCSLCRARCCYPTRSLLTPSNKGTSYPRAIRIAVGTKKPACDVGAQRG